MRNARRQFGCSLDVTSWRLVVDTTLAIGDRDLGIWKALPQVPATTRDQRCRVHKTANVLSGLPVQSQLEAKVNYIKSGWR